MQFWKTVFTLAIMRILHMFLYESACRKVASLPQLERLVPVETRLLSGQISQVRTATCFASLDTRGVGWNGRCGGEVNNKMHIKGMQNFSSCVAENAEVSTMNLTGYYSLLNYKLCTTKSTWNRQAHSVLKIVVNTEPLDFKWSVDDGN
jgi:hypothetical protein